MRFTCLFLYLPFRAVYKPFAGIFFDTKHFIIQFWLTEAIEYLQNLRTLN